MPSKGKVSVSITPEARDALKAMAEKAEMNYSEYLLHLAATPAPQDPEPEPEPVEEPQPEPQPAAVDVDDEKIKQLLRLIDTDVTNPQELMKQLSMDHDTFREHWRQALKRGFVVAFGQDVYPFPQNRGPLIADEGVEFAGLEV